MTTGARLQDLARIESAVWDELQRAARTRGHPWRTAVLATREGELADARFMVLRDVRTAERELLFYTDARSAKVVQAGLAPLATVAMWAADPGWQLRCRVRLSVQTDGLDVSSRWARLRLSPAAQDYLSPLPPGAAVDAPPPLPPRDGRHHFAVLVAQVLSLDWLELHAEGHRRARFDADGARWLQP
ncbi:pyridoxamine 5'-phosphate oxidase [Caldimonas thermodepolymerans]|jgi:hypothetical protein|uniref:Pyridoxamine 5'-phosphate oxidase n=1 Tax=Caldimonas thermodepolymerans TaxID=215580 RepID=A0A2S5T8F7_9BURK|nr:pyridoxamine 5'-phosphate oxidase [Caldimonas thermodepolymerans]PPE71263.1 pyridoxamine 5'-phosphate oxidase [Caldimonas thermodepolymerans]QPC32437.1 pyridoxamine 5'-phosphate oxidase [Caldimonas thermodepolymerans]RDH98824.1 hypothetical protein DES46_10696 [Caldimonas thermodepolymerans]TCP06222.1 hypothetical protein EV676_10793 [Caldimonas thermodepolymerans]UZG45233.1 pyridoxamine 5'-phosphate oxidase [Caldimonas thermodepolymerans]